MKINLTKEELELLLITVKDYGWVGEISDKELDKMKRKLKYYIDKEEN